MRDDTVRGRILRALRTRGVTRAELEKLDRDIAGSGADVASPFQALFGEGYVGRPLRNEHPIGMPTGNSRTTEAARRRATRVLRYLYREEFERLMKMEAEWLQEHGGV
jgi:hypothetical protein